jgi:AcrR family transcriptional regulator
VNIRSDRRSRHRASDRDLLLQMDDRVFSERGYDTASMRDIARADGFSIGGVSQSLGTKGDLYLAIIDRSLDLCPLQD